MADNLLSLTLSALMQPQHSNIYGIVSGGTIMTLMEEAASLLVSRYCNSSAPCQTYNSKEHGIASPSLVRMERAEFMKRVHFGDVSETTATIMYTSHNSIEIHVTFHVLNVVMNEKSLTNSCKLWYVPINVDKCRKVLPVSQLKYATQIEEDRGRVRYEKQKSEREENKKSKERNIEIDFEDVNNDMEDGSVAATKCFLSLMVNPPQLNRHNICRGGVILRLMDNCATIISIKQSRSKAVTSSFDMINFYTPVPQGALLTCTGQATWTNKLFVESLILCDMEIPKGDTFEKVRVADGYITFCGVDDDFKVIPMKQLFSGSLEEHELFHAGQKRFEQQKARELLEQQQLITKIPTKNKITKTYKMSIKF